MECLHEAASLSHLEPDKERKALLLSEIGTGFVGLNMAAAKKYLNQSWDLGEQNEAVRGWAMIDEIHARALASRIKDPERRKLALDEMPVDIAQVDLARAVHLLNRVFPREDQTLQVAYGLMDWNLGESIKLVNQVSGVDKDGLLSAIASNAPESETATVLPLIKDRKKRDEAQVEALKQRFNRDPREMERVANGMVDPLSEANVLSFAVTGFLDQGSPRARFLADKAADLLRPVDTASPASIYRDTDCLWRLMASGSAKAASLAKKWEKSGPSISLAAVWAQVDLDKAEKILEKVHVDRAGMKVGLEYADIGTFIADDYKRYLSSLSRRQPEKAAKLLAALGQEEGTPDPWSRGLDQFVEETAQEILEQNDKRFPAEMDRFAAAFQGSKGVQILRQLRMAEKIRANPKLAETLLPKFDPSLFSGSIGVEAVGYRAAMELAQTDVKAAVRLAQVSSDGANSIFEAVSANLAHTNPGKCLWVLRQGEAWASAEGDPGARAFNLCRIAESAEHILRR